MFDMFLRILDLWVMWSERVWDNCEWGDAQCLFHNGRSLHSVVYITLRAAEPNYRAIAYFRGRVEAAAIERWPV